MSGRKPAGPEAGLTVDLEVSPAHECLMSLAVFTDAAKQTSYEVGQSWFEQVRSLASSELLAALVPFTYRTHQVWEHLVSLVYDCPAPRDVPALLRFLEQTDPLEVRLHLLGYYEREHRRVTPPEVVFQAAQGDPEAQRRLLATSFPQDAEWQQTLHWVLGLDAEATKLQIEDLLRRWYEEVFRQQEAEIIPILGRDAEAKRALQASLTAEQLIESATGWDYLPEPGIRQAVLIPSFVLRPWSMLGERAHTRIFCYPVADESVSADPATPPARLVRLLKALADERRLRVVRRLAAGSATLQTLADEFGVAKTTMHHHLTALRQAGLVRMSLGDNRYSLRSGQLESLSEWLETYAKRP